VPKDRLTIVFVTMGETTTEPSLQVLRKEAPDHHVVIWNNGCVDPDFVQMLNNYSHDVINCTRNQGLLEALNYVFLTSQSDYILFTTAGVNLAEGQIQELMTPFSDPDVGITSEYQLPIDKPMGWPIECGENDIPEGVEIYRRTMLDDIGNLCPSFRIWGTAQTELKIRAMRKGWKVMGIRHRAKHINVEGQGKDLVGKETIQAILLHNNVVMNHILNCDFQYKWWRTDMLANISENDLNIPLGRVMY